MSDNLMRVQPIRNGTVIDHIKAGRGRKVLDALELIDKGTTITLLMHVPSTVSYTHLTLPTKA